MIRVGQVILLSLVFGLSACSEIKESADGVGAPIRLAVKSQRIGSGEVNTWANCFVPTTSNYGSTSHCTASIPEGELYYSSLILNLEVNPHSCYTFAFIPYTYRISNSGGCAGSLGSLPIGCFGGAGPILVPSFGFGSGQYNSIIYDTAQSNVKQWSLPAAYNSSTENNRNVCNNLAASKREQTISEEGEQIYGGYMLDWTFQCRNRWYDVTYAIDLIVSTAPSSPGSSSQVVDFPDWGEY